MTTTSLYEDSLKLSEEQFMSLDGVPVLKRLVGDSIVVDDFVVHHELQFAFLGCEERFGYGPLEHTASLFLDLLCLAAKKQSSTEGKRRDLWTISVHVYNAKLQQYPKTFKDFSGVILPGSYSSAYDENVLWMEKMKLVIQDVLVPQQIPTLGMCFGHQIMAQSFYPHGKVSKLSTSSSFSDKRQIEENPTTTLSEISTPSTSRLSPRAGRVSFHATGMGQRLLGKAVMNFYVTHGDFVEKLPDTAVSLGGDEAVPIQAAAYYATAQEAHQAEQQHYSHKDLVGGTATTIRPYAITFQSHLEYATSMDWGLHRTLEMVMEHMVSSGNLSHDDKQKVQQDARENYPQVEHDSVEAMCMVGRLLGWFSSAD